MGPNPAPEFPLDVLYLDFVSILPGDYLVKVDRVSMAESLEVRLPLLDPEIVKFCFRLPSHLRTRTGQSKWALRQVLRRYLPESLVWAGKRGFEVPMGNWLRGPLREWAEDLLAGQSLRRSQLLATDVIRGQWHEHCSGRSGRTRKLWNVLMFQAWYQSQGGH